MILHDKSIVSYVIGHSNNNDLVFKNIDMAIKASSVANPMIHSDRGYQYTSNVGIGQGRGIGLLFIISGAFVVILAFITYRIKSIQALTNN